MRQVTAVGERLRLGEPITPAPSVWCNRDSAAAFDQQRPAVLVVAAETVRDGSLYGTDSRGYEMSMLDSIDIDAPDDLELAELLLGRRDLLHRRASS